MKQLLTSENARKKNSKPIYTRDTAMAKSGAKAKAVISYQTKQTHIQRALPRLRITLLFLIVVSTTVL
mgnify:CR=1 FL=1